RLPRTWFTSLMLDGNPRAARVANSAGLAAWLPKRGCCYTIPPLLPGISTGVKHAGAGSAHQQDCVHATREVTRHRAEELVAAGLEMPCRLADRTRQRQGDRLRAAGHVAAAIDRADAQVVAVLATVPELHDHLAAGDRVPRGPQRPFLRVDEHP